MGHFGPLIVLALLALPWPVRLENAVVQTLMGGVAAATTEMVNWLGLGAVRRGNLIELSGGTVGIDEACSGIRSFQTLLVFPCGIGLLRGTGILPLSVYLAVVRSSGIEGKRELGVVPAGGYGKVRFVFGE